MNIFDFHIRYCFITFNDDKWGLKILFYPPDNANKGAMNTTFADGKTLGGEYALKLNEDGSLEISWLDAKFWFVPTELGFDLLNYDDSSITYSFSRPIQ